MRFESVPGPANGIQQIRIIGDVNDPTLSLGESQPLNRVLGSDCFLQTVLFDLRQATSIDTGGVAWLVGCHKEFDRWGGRMILHSIPPSIMQVFDLLKLRTLLRFADSEPHALQCLANGTW